MRPIVEGTGLILSVAHTVSSCSRSGARRFTWFLETMFVLIQLLSLNWASGSSSSPSSSSSSRSTVSSWPFEPLPVDALLFFDSAAAFSAAAFSAAAFSAATFSAATFSASAFCAAAFAASRRATRPFFFS